MRDQDSIGRCNMNANPVGRVFANLRPINLLLTGVVLMCATSALAEEYPADAVELDAESGQRIEEPGARRDWRLDPVVFTEISPVTATEIAIKLPEDQREED